MSSLEDVLIESADDDEEREQRLSAAAWDAASWHDLAALEIASGKPWHDVDIAHAFVHGTGVSDRSRAIFTVLNACRSARRISEPPAYGYFAAHNAYLATRMRERADLWTVLGNATPYRAALRILEAETSPPRKAERPDATLSAALAAGVVAASTALPATRVVAASTALPAPRVAWRDGLDASVWRIFARGLMATMVVLIAAAFLAFADRTAGFVAFFLGFALFCLTDYFAARRRHNRVILPPPIARAGIVAFPALAALVAVAAS